MKRIEYKITWQHPRGSREDIIAVFARDINTGARKALRTALHPTQHLQDEEFVSIQFWQVTS